LIDFGSRGDKNLAALLKVVNGVCGCFAHPVGDKGTGRPRRDLALPLYVGIEERIHDGSSSRVREDLASKPDQSPSRYMELQPHASRAVVHHFHHLALAASELFDDDTEKRLRTINDKHLHRFMKAAINRFGKNLRLTDHQFISFA